jgi:hypothetical protein
MYHAGISMLATHSECLEKSMQKKAQFPSLEKIEDCVPGKEECFLRCMHLPFTTEG